jgi:translocation and assembly module TamB
MTRGKKLLGWTLAGVAASIIVVASVGVVVVRSRWFHAYLLGKITAEVQQSTGGRVDVGNYVLHWSDLHADIYRLALHGTEADPSRPLLAIDHLGVGLKIISLLGRNVSLNDITIDRPVVRLVADSNGQTNLPQPPKPAKASKPVDVFNLAVKHFALNKGDIYYNDQKMPLDAELHDVRTLVRFDALRTAYEGTLDYRQGRVRFSNFNPLQSDFEAAFTADRSALTLHRLVLATPGSRFSAQASLKDYSNPAIEGNYRALLSTPEFGRILKESSLPGGTISISGSLKYQNSPARPFLDALFVDGRFRSDVLSFNTSEGGADIRDVRGHYRLDRGNLEASDLEAGLLGGRVTANLSMHHLSGTPNSRLLATVRDISLGSLKGAVRNGSVERVSLSGDLNGNLEASWHGSMQGLRAHSDATIDARTASASDAGGTHSIPVNGAVHLDYDGSHSRIALDQTFIHTPHTDVQLNGVASERSSLDVRASSSDLHELDMLGLALRRATAGRPSPHETPLQPFGVYGSAAVRGQMQGRMQNPRFVGELTASNIRVQQVSIPQLRTSVNLSSSAITVHHGDLQTGNQARIEFDASIGLRHWNYTASNPVTLQVSTARFPIIQLENVAKVRFPVSGLVTANISVHGSQLRPAGQGSIQLTQATAWEQPIQNLALQFQGTGNTVHSVLTIHTPAGNARADLTYRPQNQGYDAQIEARNINLANLQAVRSRNLGISGLLSVSGRGRGTLKSPQGELTVQIPKLSLRDQKVSAVTARLNVANQHANVALDSKLAQAYVKAAADIALRPDSDYYTTASLDVHGLPLGPLLGTYSPQLGDQLRGQTEVHASLKGPLKKPVNLEAHLEVPNLAMSYQSFQIASVTPIRADYRNGVFTLQPAHIKGTDTDLQLEGTVPLKGAGGIRASAQGSVNLQIAQVLNPSADSSGQLRLNVSATGDKAHPDLHGQINIVNAAFQVPGSPLGVEKMNGEFAIRNDRLQVTEFTAESGGGNLTAAGFIAYRPAIQFGLGLTAKNVRLRYPRGLRALLDGRLGLNGTYQSALLNGQVRIDRLSFTNEFDLSNFMNQFSGPSAPPESEQGFAQNLKLNVALQSAQELAATSAKLSVQGSADMRVAGTLANPVILGRTTLTGGEVFFIGHRYEVRRGVVDFANPVRTEPVVNLSVMTTVEQYNLTLNFVGPFERLRTTYSSDPPLPPVDIINLLAFGKTTEESAGGAGAPGSLGAESVLAQGLSSQVSSRLEKFAGISHLSIDPLIGGNTTNPGATIAIQQRVTKNLLFTFATDVRSTQAVTIQLEYQVSRGWSVSVVRDQYGGFAFDARRHKNF